MKKSDLNWLSGFLEGEGSFLKPSPSAPNTPKIVAITTDEDIIQRVALLLGVGYGEVGVARRKQNPHWKKSYGARKRGRGAVYLMKILYPLMGVRRKQQIKAAINAYDPNKSGIKINEVQVRDIRKRCGNGENQSVLANEYGLHRTTICKINRGHRWRGVV
ncbi:MAG TPA: hypothetical protein ENH60_04325 [Pricia sp.]|nr:hypothetical protein [Pricia sp.]